MSLDFAKYVRKPKWEWKRKCKSLSCVWLFATPCPWNSPGQNTGVGSLFLLQGIFPTQESNPGLLHCRRILYQLSHKGNPRVLQWIAYSFSRGSSQPRNRTQVSCLAGSFFTGWTRREDCRGTEFLIQWWWECQMLGHFGRQFGSFLKS